MQVVTLEPHGLCAGVNAAIAMALKLRNVYCLHQLVHNEIVNDELRALGFKFVENVVEVPEGSTMVISAHGVAPSVYEEAKRRNLKVVDLTCAYVKKAQSAAYRAARAGKDVEVIGDSQHVEVKGILGHLQRGREEAKRATATGLAVVCQTTLNLDDAQRKVEEIAAQHQLKIEDIEISWPCRATQERQDAVRKFAAEHSDGKSALLVLGSRTSANTKRLCEVAEQGGVKAYQAGTMEEVRALCSELEQRHELVGVTSGASTPERFFSEAVKLLRHIPEHVAIIMDGNGRWATQRGKARGEGHIAGAKTLTKVLKWCGARGIDYLTVYAFSTENWKRPKAEVDGLMSLFAKMLKTKEKEFIREQVRFRMIGRRGDLSPKLQQVVAALEEKTRHFHRQFIVAISYGGRAEIVDAVNAAIQHGERVTEETFRSFMYAPDVPDPDLVIRTSGELRTSNFLLWESAYSEYAFLDTLWPDFSESDLDRALEDYAGRHRRKGGV